MADAKPRAGELTTANYGWTKPTVGASVDAWGDQINTDLDGIDSIVHGIQTSVPAASTTPPVMNGAVAVGAGTTWARADHVHPTDARIIGDNRIINGDMRIDQRNGGASGTATGYTIDRWQYASNQASKGTWQRTTAGPVILALGFGYCLTFTSSSAYASLAADGFTFNQVIEADMISDFAWGTPNAQPATLSFWAASTLGGTFSGSIKNVASTRSYPFTYSLIANTWAKIAITIPGDTVGTWMMSGNAGSMYVVFDLGTGSNRRGPANAWASTDYSGVTGAVSVVGTNGAAFQMTGVKLEIGSVATPYNRQSLAKSLADCQRYFICGPSGGNLVNLMVQGNASGAGFTTWVQWSAPVTMRATPTINAAWGSGTNATAGGVSMLNDARTLQSNITSLATSGYVATLTVNSLSAEL